jgi:thymidine kinase
MDDQGRHGHVEVICGSMFSGKTEELIRRVRRAQIARQQVQVFKPALDDRYGVKRVTSHNGVNVEAHSVNTSAEILKLVRPTTHTVAIVAGLDTDVRGEPFGPMPVLIAQAEKVDKLRAICVVCGEEASRTQRLINGQPAAYDDPVIMVGAKEVYEARCRHCHQVAHERSET